MGQNGPNSFDDPPSVHERWIKALKASDEIDKSVRELPYLYYEVCDAYADAINDQRRLKDRYDEAYAEAETKAWGHKVEGERLTVAKVKAVAESTPSVQKIAKRLRHATEAVTKLEALRSAFQQKASMLKAEVELVASQFIQRDHVQPRTRRG